MLDLKRLAVLREVGARGSLAAAAKALSYTPSAVSQQMTALSRDIGVLLFERTPRGMRLTDSAHALIAHCETVFDRLAQAQADLEAIAGGVGGRLRLGSFPTATVAFTAAAIGRFRRLHPGVDLRFADGEPYESVVRLKERELDIAVIFEFDHWTAATDYDGASVCADRDIECVELFDDPFHVVMPSDHLLAGRKQVELRDLCDERVIGAPSSCSPWGADFQRLLQCGGLPARVRVVLPHGRLRRAAGDRRHGPGHHTCARPRAERRAPGNRRAALARRRARASRPPRNPRRGRPLTGDSRDGGGAPGDRPAPGDGIA
jgi:DNA-binding transcriptional LysR family regulator